LQQIAGSIRGPAYLVERMFPQLRERIGPALDLVVEFSTLGEYRLGADGALHPASALPPAVRKRPARSDAQRFVVRKRPTRPDWRRVVSSGPEPQLGGAGVDDVARAAVRRIVAGGAAGGTPVATPAARRQAVPARPHSSAARRQAPRNVRRAREHPTRPAASEQLCFAV
jgi:hypothetical protein